ncbi:MAG: hypothetical protein IIT45_07640, partial [Treponema sp.]|nr:hypothetical protein [Treponema sp.]
PRGTKEREICYTINISQAAKALAELETMKFTPKTNRGNFSEDDLSGLIHNNGACVAVFSG